MVRLRCVDKKVNSSRISGPLLFGVHQFVQMEELVLGPEGDLKKELFALSQEYPIIKELIPQADLWQASCGTARLCGIVGRIAAQADRYFPRCGSMTIQAQNMTIGERDLLPLKPGDYVKLSIRVEFCRVTPMRAGQFAMSLGDRKECGSIVSMIAMLNGYIDIWQHGRESASVYIYLPAVSSAVNRL